MQSKPPGDPVAPASERTRVRRRAHRGHYDRGTIDAILDEGFVGHLGFVDDEHPFVIPVAYGRDGDRVLIHGSSGSRMMRTLGGGADVCLTVTHVDGVVVARAAFNQSINYRSAVILGRARSITDPDVKLTALATLSERLIPGVWDGIRGPSTKELAATTILELGLDEASAKIRSGPAIDEDEDYALPIWSGVIPTRLQYDEAVADPRNLPDVTVPGYVSDYSRPRTAPTPEG